MNPIQVLQRELAPAVVVAIGGKDLSLVYDLQAVILYKQKTGDSLFQEGTFAKINPQEDPERFAACLWAGLQRKHPEVTLAWLGEEIPFGPEVNPLIEAMTKAVTAHFPKAKAASPNAAAPEETPAQEPQEPPPPLPMPVELKRSAASPASISG
ncbi:MAG TPA: hypothetical protein VGM18_04885 [Candidatus Sulfotelmatobacter sp.]|jgi:hypothetical protein